MTPLDRKRCLRFLASLSVASSVWLATSNLGASAVSAHELSATERQPLPVTFLNPSPSMSTAQQSLVLHALDSALRRVTLFRLVPIDAPLGKCEGRISCVVPEISRIAVLKDASERTALVLAISLDSEDGAPERAMPLLWDQRVAERALGKALRNGVSTDAAEVAVAQAAVLWRATPADLSESRVLDAWAAGVVSELRPLFSERGVWRPFGAIELRSSVENVVIDLDGRTIGLGAGRKTLITEVRTGTRLVRVSNPGYMPFERPVRVEAGEVTSVTAELTLAPDYRPVKVVSLLLSSAVVAAASSIALWSASFEPARAATCNNVPTEVGRLTCLDRTATFYADGSGMPVLPLGLSLAVGGGSMLASELALNEDSRLSLLLPLGVGLALGTLTFGVVGGAMPDK